jgi:hypothetical protein
LKLGIFAANSEKTVEVELKTYKVRVRSSVPICSSRSKLVVEKRSDGENSGEEVRESRHS